MKRLFLSLCLCASVVGGCTPKPENRVTLYCSVDEVYAKPLVAALEQRTGLQIDALYDVEAAKTAGLANKMRAEKNRPRADVFWSSALLQTLLLEREGLLEPYISPNANDVPASFKGKAWTGVGVRARVIMQNTNSSIGSDMCWGCDVRPNWMALTHGTVKNRIAISNPQFGTASDWSAALAVRWGQGQTLDYFRKLKANGVRVLPGNGDVARQVKDNAVGFGVTDSDDFLAQYQKAPQGVRLYPFNSKQQAPHRFPGSFKKNGKIHYFFGYDGSFVPGPIFIPGAAAILKNAPHPENAKKLLDALVSAENETALTKEMPGVFSLRKMDEKANWQSGGEDFSFLMGDQPNDAAKWPAAWDKIKGPLAQILSP